MKKAISLCLILLMLIGLLAGCGSAPAASPVSATPAAASAATDKDTTPSATPSATPEATPEPTPEPLAGEFTWWSFFDQTPFLKEQFEKQNPNIKINLETFGGSEYQTKLMTTLISGQNIPDLMDLEEGYVYKLLDSPMFVDLGPLGGEELVQDYYPWAAAMGRDANGTLKGICDNVSPVAFWYLRDAMETWLGTSDDTEISEKLSDWDKIIAAAKDIKEKSDGKVYLWANLNEVVKVEGYAITPFVRNGTFSVDPEWMKVMSLMRTLWNEGLVADLGSWSGEWATAWNAGTLLIRCMPSWDFFTDWKTNEGNVGVAKPPRNSYEGGTYRVIYAQSEKTELCMEFLRFLTTVDYQVANLETNNQMPANRTVISQIGDGYTSEKFGGQNILKTYDGICGNIKEIIPDQYTRNVQNLFAKHCAEGIKNGLSDEEILDNFKKEVKDKYPEIQGL